MPASPSDNEWDAERIKDWIVANSRSLTIAVSAAVVLGAVFAFWQQSVRLKNERAEAALATAQGAFYSGNTTLAKSDLEKLTARYPGTSGATQAGLLLAQILYGEGKYDDGIASLTALVSSAPDQFKAPIEELIAAGYADSNRPEQAAAHLALAASLASFPVDQQMYRADAARMLRKAGKTDEARAIWAELAKIPDSPMLTEAKVRLGEIDAAPATP